MFENQYKIFAKYLIQNFRIKIIQIFLLSVFETLLEIFSIVVLIAALSILFTQGSSDNWFASFVLKFEYDFNNKLDLFYLIIFVYVLKNLILALIQWVKLDLCGKIFKELSQSTYQALLKKNSLFFNNFSSGDLAQNVISESEFTKGVIISFVGLFTELLIIITMFFLIASQNIYAAFITLIFLTISSYVYYFFMKQKNLSFGEKRQFFSIKIMNLLFHSLAHHKLIILSDKIKFFIKKFSNNISVIYKVARDQMVIQYSSRLWLECCILLILVFTISPLVETEDVSSSKISDILLISIISLRFVPSFSNILGSYSTIQYGSKAVSNIMNILKKEKTTPTYHIEKIVFNQLILENISFKYENNNETLIKNFNHNIKNNSLVGVKGENGSGKSTILRIISGLIEPDNGRVLMDKQSIYDDQAVNYNWKKNIGYADQKLVFSNETILKTIAFGEEEKNIDEQFVADCLKKLDLLDFFMKMPNKLNTFIGENGKNLSGGQLQKLNIARALYLNPKILILDEVTNNLDTKSQEKFVELIKSYKKNCLILIATHSEKVLNECDNMIEL